MLGNFSFFWCRLITFLKLLYSKILSWTLSECQTVWIQIRTDILSVLILIQTVCKGYQQRKKVTASNERIKLLAPKRFPFDLDFSLTFWIAGLPFFPMKPLWADIVLAGIKSVQLKEALRWYHMQIDLHTSVTFNCKKQIPLYSNPL